jgi:hypothetical protein
VLVIPTYEEKADGTTKSTTHLIERAISRLARAGGRRTEGDAPHLLEAIAVVVYDPGSATLNSELPAPGSDLRWESFIKKLALLYDSRFGSELPKPKKSGAAKKGRGKR